MDNKDKKVENHSEKKTLEVLLIDQQPQDVALVKELLLLQRDVEQTFRLEISKKFSEAQAKLQQMAFDVVLLDLPSEESLGDFEALHKALPRTAVIVLTSAANKDLGKKAIQSGAQDYLVKDNMESSLLTRSMTHAMERVHLIERLENSLRSEIEERKKMDILKDEFVSTVSHELRTPLAIVKSAIENLRDGIAGDLNEKQGRTVQIAARNLDRLTTIINDLLDLSRLESGKMVLNRHRVSLHSVVQELFQGYQTQARAKNIRLIADIPQGMTDVYVDPDLLMQVLNNLMNDALRYTKTKIVVKAQSEDAYVRVSIEDDGEGIGPEDLPKLFGKFQQINRPSGGAGYKGTGLGLAICREIINQHEGKIWAESDLGQGTRFVFTVQEYQSDLDFWPKMTAAFEEARLNRESLAILAINVENIRDLKKTQTDEAIQDVFKKIQGVLRKDALRRGDQLFHYSQKEFVAIMARTGRQGADVIQQRIHQVLEAISKEWQETAGDVPAFQFKLGSSVFPEDGETPEIVLKKAMEEA